MEQPIPSQSWPWWPLLPLYPYGRRRTLVRTLIPGQVWSFEQLQGIFYVAVPIRMTVLRLRGGLLLYAPVPPTEELLGELRTLERATDRCARSCCPPARAWSTSCRSRPWRGPSPKPRSG